MEQATRGMNYETKFYMGQSVWVVTDTDFRQIIPCLTCRSAGKVVIGNEEFVCPKCDGRSKHPQYAGQKYYISTTGSIGKIQVEHQETAFGAWISKLEVSYMITSTGVGGGNVWKEEQLFATEADALAYCAEKNSRLLVENAALEQVEKYLQAGLPH